MTTTAWNPMTPAQVHAVLLAVSRDASVHEQWDECAARTLADLCSSNQDALIDDWYEDPALLADPVRQAEIRALVAVYDELLGTNRAAELTHDALNHPERTSP